MNPLLLPFHLGDLHPYEKALTLLLAFGPVLVLGLVVWLRTRHERRAEPGDGLERDGQRDR